MKRLLAVSLAVVLALGLSIVPFPVQAVDVLWNEHTIKGDFGGAHSVYATDVDGDGDIDVLGAAVSADDISWWENDGSENFTERIIKGDFDGATSVYATDVDGDGDVDVLGTASVADDLTWWENDGGENFTEHTIDADFDSAHDVHAIDVDGDGDVDVLGAANIGGQIAWWENDGSQKFAKHTIIETYPNALSVYATDVDGDGDIDVLGASYSYNDISWWENDGSENFTRHSIKGGPRPPMFDGAASVYATDVDGDGDVDVFGAARNDDDITWWENDGSENFSEHTIKGNFNSARSVYATDVDDDGDIDVLGAAHSADDITWWENDGSQNFTEHTIAGSFDGAICVYATDVDGDGDVDVLGAAENANDITWWENLWEPAVEATIDIDPNTLNLKSKGKWITAYIELPEGYDVADIDATTVLLNDTVPAVTDPSEYITDKDDDGILERMVKFDRSAVQGILGVGDEVEITVTGEVAGTPFEGSDIIRVK